MTANERLAAIKARVEAIRDENPHSYNPWDDDSVDPTNTGDVVHAAVSRGWDAGVRAEVPTLVAALEAVLEATSKRHGPEVSQQYEMAMESIEDIITGALREDSD